MENFKKLIGEDVFKQHIEPKLGTEKKYFFGEGDFIPKGRFDEINTQTNDYKKQLSERDEQLKALQEKAKGNDDLTKQIEALQAANQTAAQEYESKLSKQAFDFSYKSNLEKANARDLKLLDALIDKEKVVFKDGNFTGLNEQIEALRKTHDYVFNGTPVPTPDKIGRKIGGVPPVPGEPYPAEPAQQRSWNKHKRF